MANDESLSLEETNRVRRELGLAELAGDDAEEESDVDKDEIAEQNYANKVAADRQARADRETKERLAKANNQRQLRAKLQGKGLREDTESVSAADWVKRSRAVAKGKAAEIERLRLKEQEEKENRANYDENDLVGLKIDHDLDEFEEGKNVILTLADKRVLDEGEEGDSLQNVNLAEYQRTKQRLDNKKKAKEWNKYNPYEDEEEVYDPSKGRKEQKGKSLLGKYDEELGIVSDKAEGFRIGQPSTSSSSRPVAAAVSSHATNGHTAVDKVLLSLDYTRNEQTDYLQEGDVGFKKPKKSKKSKSRVRTAVVDEDIANGDTLMVEEEDIKPKNLIPSAQQRLLKEGAKSEQVVDDEELQAALARQRRKAGKERLKAIRTATPVPTLSEEVVDNEGDENMLEDIKVEEEEQEEEDSNGLVLDDTSEFIRNISARPLIASRAAAASNRKGKQRAMENTTDVGLTEVQVKEEEEEEEEMEEGEASEVSDGEQQDAVMEEEEEEKAVKEEEQGQAFGSTADERLVSGGMASTLSLLRQSGLIKALTKEEIEKERQYKEREAFIARQRMEQMEREYERNKLKASAASLGKGNDKENQAAREYENKRLLYEQASKQLVDFNKNYKPNVDITYHDEFGRTLSQKEAWKDLSHKFHGKGSSTNKRDKMLKRIEEEKKREKMQSGDSPLNTNAAFQARQERMGSATMVLGVGNKNTAPSADQLLGPAAAKVPVELQNKRKVGAGTSGGVAKKKKEGPKILG